MTSLLKSFIKFNRELSQKTEKILPHTKPDITEFYQETVVNYMNAKKNLVIADIGGGRLTPFANFRKPSLKTKIIALDIDKKELAENKEADKKIVADLNKGLPLPNNSVDIITSRYTVEHLKNVEKAIKDMQKALSKGGLAIHLFPSKLAPFVILNRLMPESLSHWLLEAFVPGGHEIHGFKTFYDHCLYSPIKKTFESNGFKIKEIHLSYYQSRYYSFFYPLYLVSAAYELVLYYLNIKPLASYILVIAEKK